MTEYCVWPDGTYCEKEDLDEYLDFLSDDYFTIDTEEQDVWKDICYDRLSNEKQPVS